MAGSTSSAGRRTPISQGRRRQHSITTFCSALFFLFYFLLLCLAFLFHENRAHTHTHLKEFHVPPPPPPPHTHEAGKTFFFPVSYSGENRHSLPLPSPAPHLTCMQHCCTSTFSPASSLFAAFFCTHFPIPCALQLVPTYGTCCAQLPSSRHGTFTPFAHAATLPCCRPFLPQPAYYHPTALTLPPCPCGMPSAFVVLPFPTLCYSQPCALDWTGLPAPCIALHATHACLWTLPTHLTGSQDMPYMPPCLCHVPLAAQPAQT